MNAFTAWKHSKILTVPWGSERSQLAEWVEWANERSERPSGPLKTWLSLTKNAPWKGIKKEPNDPKTNSAFLQKRKGAFLVTKYRVFKGTLSCSLSSFAHTAHSAHSAYLLHIALLCIPLLHSWARSSTLLTLFIRSYHSLCSLALQLHSWTHSLSPLTPIRDS